jgi:hypothetical protein
MRDDMWPRTRLNCGAVSMQAHSLGELVDRGTLTPAK